MRFRIRSLMIAITIVALTSALIAQRVGSARREAVLMAEIERSRRDIEFARLALQVERELAHVKEVAREQEEFARARAEHDTSSSVLGTPPSAR